MKLLYGSTHLLFSILFNFHSISTRVFSTENEQKLNKNGIDIEQKLNRNWTEFYWKLRMDNERLVKCSRLVYNRMYEPGTLNWAFIVRPQFQFNFCSISVKFPFNLCLIFVQFLFKFHLIELKSNGNWTGSKKADELTHTKAVFI